MLPSEFSSPTAGSGTDTEGATNPQVHVHTVVINLGDADGTAASGNAGMANLFPAVPATVTAAMTAAMDLSELPGLVDLLGDTTPATTAAREWCAPSCPPFAPEEVISTFEVVESLAPTLVTTAAFTDRGEADVADRATSPSPHPIAEVKECAICLEPLFRTSVVPHSPESSEHVPKSEPCPSVLSASVTDAPAVVLPSVQPHSQAPASPSCRPPADAAAVAPDAVCSPAHGDGSEAAKDAKTVREVYCGHRFHESCILRWIMLGHYSCPLCRSPFVFE
ncbi:hypothetical protein LSCM1_04732 [Leishmania martiniquensis]|uniref:RING-type domain-containing protein n=1 Tax=Leishmania martiniquensis TaxID=1580590 RepID=A0A836KVB5_9TRYP|nr:hypothetical protein LSCM1_04732 [Leishmania martiniquensis]